jgi:hypothetical protein
MMKIVAVLFAFAAVATAMKKELHIKNICSNPIFSVPVLEDLHGGAVDGKSKISAVIEGRVDTSPKDPFDQVTQVKAWKYAIFGYVKIPDFIMNKVGKGVETMLRKLYKRDLITYHGNGKYTTKCLFKEMYGHCLPPKGKTSFVIDKMAEIAAELKKQLGPLANGWVKVQAVTTAPGVFSETVSCFEIEVKVHV